MKFLVCLGLISFCAFAQDNEADLDDENDYEPIVYSDISKKAQENAIKQDGLKAIAGICSTGQEFKATVRNGSTDTKTKFSGLKATVGMDLSENFYQNWLAGVSILFDIGGTQKKSGSWSDFNADYNSRMGAAHAASGTLSGELKTSSFVPEIGLKGGYLFKKFKSAAFLKLGLSQLNGTYRYKAGNIDCAKVKISSFVPSIGFGGERRLNKKFSVIMEVNLPISKTVTKNADLIDHKIKLGRRTIRLLGTYSVPTISFFK